MAVFILVLLALCLKFSLKLNKFTSFLLSSADEVFFVVCGLSVSSNGFQCLEL